MLSTPLTCVSMGAATPCAMVSASAPGYAADTVITGGAISGYWAMGSFTIAASPAITRRIEMTMAKIGLWMQNFEIMALLLGRGARGDFHNLQRHAWLNLYGAIDHNSLTTLQSFVDKPIVAIPVAKFERTQLGFAVPCHNPHETALGTLEHTVFRPKHCLWPH